MAEEYRPPALVWLPEILTILRENRVKSATVDHIGRVSTVEFFPEATEAPAASAPADPRIAAFEALAGILPQVTG